MQRKLCGIDFGYLVGRNADSCLCGKSQVLCIASLMDVLVVCVMSCYVISELSASTQFVEFAGKSENLDIGKNLSNTYRLCDKTYVETLSMLKNINENMRTLISDEA